jgi:ferredoxin
LKNAIYYFTGTGNSLDAAQRIAERLGDCDLVNIGREKSKKITITADIAGFVFPLYFLGMPAVVHDFFRNLEIRGTPRLFCVVTAGGTSPLAALAQADSILSKKGHPLAVGYLVTMPDNYIILYDTTDEARMKALEAGHERLAAIADKIASREITESEKPGSIFSYAISLPVNAAFRHFVRGSDKRFSSSNACTGCAKCVAACSVGNIALEGGRPAWKHRCEQCLACIHSCPVHAINYGKKTANRRLYLNPDAKF